MSAVADGRGTPYWLTGPALLVFLGLVVIPLGMTILLSFYDWGQYKGIVPEFTLKNWIEIATDSYFLEIFLRTGGSFKATAEQQLLHANSVKYRVRRAVQRRGREIGDDRLDVEVALAVRRIFGVA